MSSKETKQDKKPSEQPDLAALETRLHRAEAQLAALTARIAALETPPAVHAPVVHSEAQQTAVPAQPALLYPLARLDVQKTLARPRHKAFTVAWRAREWLALHGVSPRSMEGWQDIPLETYAAVLDYAKARGARLRRCGDDACPCRDLLD